MYQPRVWHWSILKKYLMLPKLAVSMLFLSFIINLHCSSAARFLQLSVTPTLFPLSGLIYYSAIVIVAVLLMAFR